MRVRYYSFWCGAILALLVPSHKSACQVLPRPSAKASGRPCYAFLGKGDIWTVCQGKRERIILQGKGLDFAISADGSYLAVQENMEQPGSGIGRSKQLLVPLNAKVQERSRRVDYPEYLSATCGTIVSFEAVDFHAFDLIASHSMEIAPFKLFRCSSDRQVIAGWTEQDEEDRLNRARTNIDFAATIRLRLARSGKTSSFLIEDNLAFAVSPNGEYVAFSVPVPMSGNGLGPNLCIARLGTEPTCVFGEGHSISVSDDGEVIFWDMAGIAHWHAGLKTPVRLEPEGDNTTMPQPQWITPEVAAALHVWNPH